MLIIHVGKILLAFTLSLFLSSLSPSLSLSHSPPSFFPVLYQHKQMQQQSTHIDTQNCRRRMPQTYSRLEILGFISFSCWHYFMGCHTLGCSCRSWHLHLDTFEHKTCSKRGGYLSSYWSQLGTSHGQRDLESPPAAHVKMSIDCTDCSTAFGYLVQPEST